MRLCLLGPLNSVLGKEFGRVGPQGNASFLCGQWLTIGAGQLIDLHDEALLTLQNAHFVARLEK